MKKNAFVGFLSLFLFSFLFAGAMILSQHKPLWNDELYTQVKTIEGLSYSRIIFGGVAEGNNSPLFYLIQKSVCQILRFQLPFDWHGEWTISDSGSQMVLRLNSIFFMSLALVVIFYYFSRFYSLGIGGFAFLMSLTSSMTWNYGIEARPYALWVFLTTVQVLVFLRILSQEQESPRLWSGLGGTHVLLSLTTAFSLVQIAILSFLLWIFKRKNLKRYLWSAIVPFLIGIFYYAHSPKYNFSIPPDFMSLIYANVSIDQLVLIFIGGVFYISVSQSNRDIAKSISQIYKKQIIGFFFLFVLMFLAAVAFVFVLKWKAIPGAGAFGISSRYFIYLAPLGVIAVSLFSAYFIRLFKDHRWVVVNIIIFLSGLLMVRFLRLVAELLSLGLI